MNKLDKQFEGLMKGIQIDSPSKDFTLKVMERILAEAVIVKQKPVVIEDYQPVVSRKVWILLILAFISLLIYIGFSGQDSSKATEPGIWTALQDSMQKVDTKGISNFWQSAMGIFASIPSIAYLILLATMALWTLDLFLTKLRNSSSQMQIS